MAFIGKLVAGVTEIAALGLFLAMIWTWAAAFSVLGA